MCLKLQYVVPTTKTVFDTPKSGIFFSDGNVFASKTVFLCGDLRRSLLYTFIVRFYFILPRKVAQW